MPSATRSAAVIAPKWAEDLMRDRLHDELLDVGLLLSNAEAPRTESLKVSLNLINDPDIRKSIYNDPEIVIPQIRAAAITRAGDFTINDTCLEKLRVDIIDVPDTELVRISHIRKEDANRLIKLKCLVTGMSPVAQRIVVGHFKCQRCGHINVIPQQKGKLIEPFECESDACGRKNAFELLIRESEQQDFQILKLQERQEDLLGGEKPQSARAELTENHCGTVLYGSRVVVTAIVRERLKVTREGKTDQFNIVLEVVSIESDETESKVQVTDADIRMLEEYSMRAGFMDWAVNSFAPSVYGMSEIKEALLLQMVSNGLRRSQKDNTTIRDFLHIALVGDPGVAKSSLKMAMKGYDKRVVLSSGTGATVAGLTAAVIKDDLTEGYTVEAGVLPLADGGGAILDEFDKLLPPQMKHLNDALDEGRFTVHKASIHMELWSRCWMTAMLNPVDGKLDLTYGANWCKQVGIPPDTLSRFDLVFLMPDVAEVKRDSNIGYAMLNTRDIPHSGNNGNSPGSANNLMKQEEIQKLIAHAKTITPIFSRDAGDVIHKQYLESRKGSTRERISVTPRHMGALIRLAKAEAQVHLSPIVTIDHINRAIRLLNASQDQTSRDKDGNLDSGIVATGVSKDMRGIIKTIREVIRSCQEEGEPAKIGDIVLAVGERGITPSILDTYLFNLKAKRDVYEDAEGRWRVA